MRVTVEFFGPACEAAGAARLEIDGEATGSAQDLVARLAREHGGRLAHLLLVDDRLASTVLIALNDRQVSDNVSLKDGDVVSVIPPVSGGTR